MKLFIDKMTAIEDTNRLCEITCENSHKFVNIMENVAKTMFNIGSINFVGEINSNIHKSKKGHPTIPKSRLSLGNKSNSSQKVPKFVVTLESIINRFSE